MKYIKTLMIFFLKEVTELKYLLLFLLSFKGMTLLMMGSADALPEEPIARPVFVEDMTEEQLASAVSIFSTSVSCKPLKKWQVFKNL